MVTGKEYRGVNHWILSLSDFESPYWLTFRQAREKGGTIKKGEKGTLVVFWKLLDKQDLITLKPVKIPVLRHFYAFNIGQCEDIPYPKETAMPRPFTPLVTCEKVIGSMPNRPKIKEGASSPGYSEDLDTVVMPNRNSYFEEESFYRDLFHELAHSTGHQNRIDRPKVPANTDGGKGYAREELIAEMCAAYLSGHCGIMPKVEDNTASYLAGWIKMLRGDCKLIIQASAAAQKASDYILGTSDLAEKVED